jgi:hypothetical protein
MAQCFKANGPFVGKLYHLGHKSCVWFALKKANYLANQKSKFVVVPPEFDAVADTGSFSANTS